MKMKAFIVSIIICAVIVVGSIGVYCSWNAIVGTINGNKYYTSQDIQSAYDNGYNDGIKNKTELTAQVEYYKGLVDSQYTSIAGFQKDIADYKKANEKLSNGIEEKQQQVIILENQVKTLQSLNNGQQETNEQNLKTIETLNNQIKTLNSQIKDMSSQIQNNSSNVSALNSKIADLEKSVAYYEQYIANLENGEQVVATFEFDGSVYNIQIVAKNSLVSVVTPPTNDYTIFNYWAVNGEQVDLTTYHVTTNTKFVANVTYKYDVKFMVDSEEHNTQIVIANEFATLPTTPVKNGYEFDGWTTNGVDIVDISSISITQNTTFIAKFTKLHNVTFIVNDEVLETKQVRNGECIENTNCDYIWTLNGNVIDFAEYPIFADVIFIAKTEISSLKAQSWNGLSNFSGPGVWYFEDNVFYSSGSQQYRLNKETLTWELKTWTGFSPVYGSNVFHLGENVYYLRNRDHYILNKETLIWEPKVWTGLSSSFEYYSILSDGNVAYLIDMSTIYKLDEENSCCNYLTTFPSSYIHSMFSSSDFFVKDGLLYYSYKPENIDIYFDLEKVEWLNSSWNTPSYFRGYGIWRDNDNNLYYSYSNRHLYYDIATNSWLNKDWGVTDFESYYIWNDGFNYYYSKSTTHYIFV